MQWAFGYCNGYPNGTTFTFPHAFSTKYLNIQVAPFCGVNHYNDSAYIVSATTKTVRIITGANNDVTVGKDINYLAIGI